ncbi:uncharacterized protein LOC125047953 [Penaeus chinensis]|uniref:uncharacterized protein LOC125047953 n=1 Tax=Penaeus chinensis TaxID=139456 RepID=UPI001FB7E158|nr:uncharacterized protein LOC125047953 [Penaeus chinensis]
MSIQADGTLKYHGMKKIKWWRLKEFVTKVKERKSGKETTWEILSENMRSMAKVVLGETSGKAPKAGKDTWWWNEEVQQAIAEKGNSKRTRDQSQSDEAAQQFKACGESKSEAYKDLYKKLDSTEGQYMAIRMAKTRDRNSSDVRQVKLIKDGNGSTIIEDSKIQARRKKYFQKLLNEENPREERCTTRTAHPGKVSEVSKEEVKRAIKRMKTGKAVGPDRIPMEAWKSFGEKGIEWLTKILNTVVESGRRPDDWRDVVRCLSIRTSEMYRTARITEE